VAQDAEREPDAEVDGVMDRLDTWRGLPPCRLADVKADGHPGMASLGQRRAAFRAADYSGGPAQAWTEPDGDEVLMITVEHPAWGGTPAGALAALGAPELRLDTVRGTVALPGGEWAYPSRGITLYADEDDERIFRAALYAPTGPEAYEVALRPPFGPVRSH
jgi:hypothetical protein